MNKDKIVLITGASSGIGKELALAYADNNTVLLLTGRNQNRLNEIKSLCEEKGAAVETTTIDISDDTFKEQVIHWDDKYKIDIAIANAGISGGTSTHKINSPEQFQDIIDTNLYGTFNTINPLIPRMLERGKGNLVVMSSMAGFRGMPTAPAYSISKVAVRAYGDALRPILKQSGVMFSIIFPGFIKTPLTDANNFKMPFLMDAAKAAQIIKNGIEKNKAHIAFPWQMHFLSWFIGAIPRALGDKILQRAPSK